MVNSYVAVDLETTGLDPKRDKIIEIGAVRIEAGEITAEFESFVNPYRMLEAKTRTLTGIRDQDVVHAPGIEEVLPVFLNFAGELPLLGHRIIFDYSFLKRAAVNQGESFSRAGIDTLTLARLFMPAEERKNLKAACGWFGIDQRETHRAMADAVAAHQLYQAMKKRYGKEHPDAFSEKNLIYKVKKEQPASKRQKEHLQDLIKYHKIGLTVQIDHLTRNEISRITDKIIAQYGRI
ncbi:3'-5' exonuclease [Hungatella hathewayi]|uniref:3'-5' exonuclease n=1 Tax=Hungatella hathewayi TaxID=154046 RepID=UPI00242BA45B|nr:3'-5' exonuclease [Hungatella hathewayi]